LGRLDALAASLGSAGELAGKTCLGDDGTDCAGSIC
jgi:hypothetical protein